MQAVKTVSCGGFFGCAVGYTRPLALRPRSTIALGSERASVAFEHRHFPTHIVLWFPARSTTLKLWPTIEAT
jgi:hypothetical protein